jgi:hypothetical protein
VARSFYTALAEAIIANEKIPNLEAAQVSALPVLTALQLHSMSNRLFMRAHTHFRLGAAAAR